MFQNYFIIVGAILFITGILNRVFYSSKGSKWASDHRIWQSKLDKAQFRRAVNEGNNQFISLFDAIYGRKFFSIRRFIASFLSTSIFLVIVVLLLGFDNTAFGDLPNVDDEEELSAVTYAILLFVMNLIPDYFSLQETRWTLKMSSGRGLLGVTVWFVIDFILTFLIFWFCAYFVVSGVNESSFSIEEFLDWFVALSTGEYDLFGSSSFFPFLVTTYFTSLFWFLFIFYIISLKTVTSSSKFGQYFVSRLPIGLPAANAVGAVAFVFVSVGFALTWLVLKII